MIKEFDNYEEFLTEYLQNASNLALLLDYDGTLTPLVAHPDLAVIPPETKKILQDIATIPNIFVAMVSGRAPGDVREKVGINAFTYAGNHGLEVIYPDGTVYNHQLPSTFNKQVEDLIGALEKHVVRDGAWIENKGASLTFHFRAVPAEKQPEVEQKAKEIVEAAGFKAGKGHLVVEARPKVDWNKGKVAVLLLDQKYGVNKWQEKVKVVFAGDDVTDEDAMLALKGNAATFRIAANADVETHADRLLSNTQSVVGVLKLILKLFKK